MAENPEHGRRCVTGHCPTDVQGGTEGMLAHLKTIHFPELSTDAIAQAWTEELWPLTAAVRNAARRRPADRWTII